MRKVQWIPTHSEIVVRESFVRTHARAARDVVGMSIGASRLSQKPCSQAGSAVRPWSLASCPVAVGT